MKFYQGHDLISERRQKVSIGPLEVFWGAEKERQGALAFENASLFLLKSALKRRLPDVCQEDSASMIERWDPLLKRRGRGR